MSAFISLTYEKYQQNFGSEFGKLITQTFYDEPSMHHADRMWTPEFNANFEKRYGYSPMKYYPALWYTLGLRPPRPATLFSGSAPNSTPTTSSSAWMIGASPTISNSAATSIRKSRSTPHRSTAT